MDVTIFGNLFIWVAIHDFGGAAIVTEEWHVGHGNSYFRDKSCRGEEMLPPCEPPVTAIWVTSIAL